MPLFAAYTYLKTANLNALLLTSTLEGEAKHVGHMLAAVAREVHVSSDPVSKPAGIVVGGETTVTVIGNGLGERNQELALAAAKIASLNCVALAAISTDGVDGPADAADAVVDGNTIRRAMKFGLDAGEFLVKNDSYNFFLKLDDLIFTGSTGTNVNDICVLIVL
ncbi:MAG: MOFRL family protein [Candidatus Bathyarchaeia archaeon]